MREYAKDLREYAKDLIGDDEEYKWICGVCGWKTIRKPRVCVSCDNDTEFEEILPEKE